jgi:hypothetical protein
MALEEGNPQFGTDVMIAWSAITRRNDCLIWLVNWRKTTDRTM